MPLNPTMLFILDHIRNELNNSEKFKKDASGWSCRILTKILPDLDVPYIFKLYMEINNGLCVELKTLEPEDEPEVDVTVTMKLSTYMKLLKGETSTVIAYLRGAVKISGPKASELRKHRGVLEELTARTRKALLEGEAIRAIFPLIKRELTF